MRPYAPELQPFDDPATETLELAAAIMAFREDPRLVEYGVAYEFEFSYDRQGRQTARVVPAAKPAVTLEGQALDPETVRLLEATGKASAEWLDETAAKAYRRGVLACGCGGSGREIVLGGSSRPCSVCGPRYR